MGLDKISSITFVKPMLQEFAEGVADAITEGSNAVVEVSYIFHRFPKYC